MLTSADRLQTKGMFGRSDPGPCCRRARDDTAINHELPSWAAFPKTVVGSLLLGVEGGVCITTSMPIRACTPLHA